MRKFFWGVLITLLVVFVGGLSVALLGYMPTHANATPPKWEESLASRALDASMEHHAPRVANPIPATDENLIEGMKIYTMNCALCHGRLDNQRSPLEHHFYPPAPQLIAEPVDDPEWHIYYAVRTGVRYTGNARLGRSSDPRPDVEGDCVPYPFGKTASGSAGLLEELFWDGTSDPC